MDEQREFLMRLIGLLDAAEIPYMLTGSLGSSFHGCPRETHDVDLVIAPAQSQLQRFLSSIGPAYYVSEEAAMEAVRRESAFNVIDMDAQWKADLQVRRARPFSLMEFSRRQKATVLGLDVWVVSPEDAILSKLEWMKGRESEVQYADAVGVAATQWKNLDVKYLLKWAQDLGVHDRLIELLEQAKAESERCDSES